MSNPREVDALVDFLYLDHFGIHNMRDNPWHWETFMAGLWGAKLFQPEIRKQMKKAMISMVQDVKFSFASKKTKGP